MRETTKGDTVRPVPTASKSLVRGRNNSLGRRKRRDMRNSNKTGGPFYYNKWFINSTRISSVHLSVTCV